MAWSMYNSNLEPHDEVSVVKHTRPENQQKGLDTASCPRTSNWHQATER